MNVTEKYLLSEARKAISNSKFAVAAAYLKDLTDCPQVQSARNYLKSARGDAEDYAAMPKDERDAYDNL